MFGGQSHWVLFVTFDSPTRLWMADVESWLNAIEVQGVNTKRLIDNSHGRDTKQDLVTF